MHRHLRIPAIVGVLACACTLTACQQPAPKITVQTGSFSTTITPSTYCFDAAHCRQSNGLPDIPVVTADDIDAKVLVDVPRAVANTGWSVQALSLDGQKTLGSSGSIKDQHTYRVVSSANSGQPFVVAVDQIRHGKPDGSRWSFLIRVAQA